MAREEQITVWGRDRQKMESQYGRVTFEEWCGLEMARLGRTGRWRDLGIRTRRTRFCREVALFGEYKKRSDSR